MEQAVPAHTRQARTDITGALADTHTDNGWAKNCRKTVRRAEFPIQLVGRLLQRCSTHEADSVFISTYRRTSRVPSIKVAARAGSRPSRRSSVTITGQEYYCIPVLCYETRRCRWITVVRDSDRLHFQVRFTRHGSRESGRFRVSLDWLKGLIVATGQVVLHYAVE